MLQAVMQAMGSDGEREMKLHWAATHLLLCGLLGSGPAPCSTLRLRNPAFDSVWMVMEVFTDSDYNSDTINPLPMNEFHSESAFVSPICS